MFPPLMDNFLAFSASTTSCFASNGNIAAFKLPNVAFKSKISPIVRTTHIITVFNNNITNVTSPTDICCVYHNLSNNNNAQTSNPTTAAFCILSISCALFKAAILAFRAFQYALRTKLIS